MIHLDLHDPRPMYEQVVDQMEMLAARGVLEADSKLPSVRQMAMELSLNPNTVQKAYAMLERDGVIRSAPGRGSFLAEQSALLDTRRRAALENLRTAVTEAVQAGVAKAKILETVNLCLEKGDLKEESEND